jgi:hypothetical protein
LLTQRHFWSCGCNGKETNLSKKTIHSNATHAHIEHKDRLRSLRKFYAFKLQLAPCSGHLLETHSYLRCSFLNCSFIISGLSKLVLNETSTSLFPATSFCKLAQERKQLKVLTVNSAFQDIDGSELKHSDTVNFLIRQKA